MKVENYVVNKSSFLSLEKDTNLIIQKILKNENLKKLLYYPVKECLDMPKLDQNQTLELINKNIKLVPEFGQNEELISYLIIGFDNFAPNSNNTEFRDNVITFDIVVPYRLWNIGDFRLRPYRIAGEIDAMFNDERLTGIGKLNFLAGNQITLNSIWGGVSLMYSAIHGEEDKK